MKVIFKKKYSTVYGMIIKNGKLYYYICDDNNYDYPISRSFELFEIIDPRLSRFWIFGFFETDQKYPVWFFPEILHEPFFFDHLTDWQQREMDIFKKYKKLMDFEFPDSSITENAQIGDENWLICPTCIAPWEYSSDKDAIVECPVCKKAMNNPRYKDSLPHY